MQVSAAAVRELRGRCNLKPKVLKAALLASGCSVDAALLALIDAGEVQTWQLNPKLVPDELFARAQKGWLNAYLAQHEQMLERAAGDRFTKELIEEQIKWAKSELKNSKAFIGLRDEKLRSVEQAEAFAAKQQVIAKHGKLKLPPFPPLKLGTMEWTGRDRLISFAGFRAGSDKPSTGTVDLEIPRLDDNHENPAPPSAEQVAAYRHLKENEATVANALLRAVFAKLRRMKREGYFQGMEEQEIPRIPTPADLKANISIFAAHVLDYAKAGYAYIGLAFRCTWDEEHDLGVLLHKSRIVEVGQADTSIDQFAAKRDGASGSASSACSCWNQCSLDWHKDSDGGCGRGRDVYRSLACAGNANSPPLWFHPPHAVVCLHGLSKLSNIGAT